MATTDLVELKKMQYRWKSGIDLKIKFILRKNHSLFGGVLVFKM